VPQRLLEQQPLGCRGLLPQPHRSRRQRSGFPDAGGVLRRNFANNSIIYGPVRRITSISYDSGNNLATITTPPPGHGHKKPGNVSVQGIAIAGFGQMARTTD